MAPTLGILHVGHGFRPWRPGGLVTYIEGLAEAQARRGHRVAYFVSGRHYPLLARPRLHRWRRRGVTLYELQNARPYFGEDAGTLDPESELAADDAERFFRRALDDARPDLVSVLDLAGLPSALVDIARDAGLPVVMTVHDYLPLCPTVKLYDADGRNCLRDRVGEECARCCSGAPAGRAPLVARTLEFEVTRLVPGGRSAARALGRARKPRGNQPAGAPAPADSYQRRRDANVARLNRVDMLIACSHRVAEIYAAHGVDRARIRTVHGTVAHLERIRPRAITSPPARPHFATLNGFASDQKGGALLLDALRSAPAVRLSAFGYVHPRLREAVAATPGVELRGSYDVERVGEVLEDVDVGLLPSVYEEPYAYSGLELLAKGIPVIANAVGGSPEYVVDGETGWLNRSNDAAGLARLIAQAARDPARVVALNARIRERRAEIVKPIARHVAELDAIYGELAR